MKFQFGDRIEVASRQVGQPVRRGEVLEVLSESPIELRVAWDDGQESNYFPSGGMARVVARSTNS